MTADVILLGEVHDNASQHAMRAGWLRSLARTRRFALVLEQFDLGSQSELDRPGSATEVRALATRAGFRFDGWHWPYYAPYVEGAVEQGLPLFAGNAPASTIMAQARAGTEPPDWATQPPWTPADTAAVSREIEIGHCGLLPARAISSIARAQRLRDQAMAQAVVEAHRRSGLPVVLLAGTGHVRRDLGVPRFLPVAWPGVRVWSVGFLEKPRADPRDPAYDQVVLTEAQPRPDPCEALRSQWQARPPGAAQGRTGQGDDAGKGSGGSSTDPGRP